MPGNETFRHIAGAWLQAAQSEAPIKAKLDGSEKLVIDRSWTGFQCVMPVVVKKVVAKQALHDAQGLLVCEMCGWPPDPLLA